MCIHFVVLMAEVLFSIAWITQAVQGTNEIDTISIPHTSTTLDKVTLKVEFQVINKPDPKPVKLNLAKGTYAIDAFTAAQNNPCYNFNYTVSKFGAFITSVCNVTNDYASKVSWMFYINNKLAPVGVSCYEVKHNDVLTLSYINTTSIPYVSITSGKHKVTLKVEFQAINKPDPTSANLNLAKGTYAIDAFTAAQNNPCYNFNYTVSKFGAFITSVCNVTNDYANKVNWMFYINNKLAPVGVSCYVVKHNDVLTLRYINTTNIPYASTTSGKHKVTLKVEFQAINKPDPKPVKLNLAKGTYAIDAFIGAQNNPCHNFNYTVSKFGAFITSVCNVTNDYANKVNWMFYINNKLAPVGVSCYEVKHNDVLTLRYINTTNIPYASTTSGKHKVTLKVEFQALNKPDPTFVNLNLGKGTYAIDAFIAAQNNPCYNFNYTVSKFGAFITSVCNVTNDYANKVSWMFYINNKLAPVGVSCYEVKHNDVLTLSYINTTSIPYVSTTSGKHKVTLKVEFQAINKPDPTPVKLNLAKGTYAIDAFIAAQNNPCHNFNYTVSKFGAFITSVCDVNNDNRKQLYWIFYVNDKLAPVAVSCYEIKQNDALTLKYTARTRPTPSNNTNKTTEKNDGCMKQTEMFNILFLLCFAITKLFV